MSEVKIEKVVISNVDIECSAEQLREIAEPVMQMSFLLSNMGQQTKRAEVQHRVECLAKAKEKLAALLQARTGYPINGMHLSSMHISTAPYMGGGVDISCVQNPSPIPGQDRTSWKIRLVTPGKVQQRLREFAQANNPTLGKHSYEFATQLHTAMGI